MSILEKKLMGVESLLSKYFLAQWNHDYDFLKFILINPVKSLAKSRRLLSCVLYQSSRSENGQWQPVMLHSNDLFCIVCSIAAQTMAKKVKYVQVNLFQKHLFLSQLTHNMTTDCSLNYQFSTWKFQAQNMEITLD